MKHLEWKHTSINYHRSQSLGRKALTVVYELLEAQWDKLLKTPEEPSDVRTPLRLWGHPEELN